AEASDFSGSSKRSGLRTRRSPRVFSDQKRLSPLFLLRRLFPLLGGLLLFGRRFFRLLGWRLLRGGFFGLGSGLFCSRFGRGDLFCRGRRFLRFFLADNQLLFFGFDQAIAVVAQLLVLQRRQLRFFVKIVFFKIHSILPWGNLARRIG